MKLSGLLRGNCLSRHLAPVVVIFCTITGAGVATAQEGGDPVAGERKAHTCLGCHGVEHYVNVYPSYHVPRIAGQNAQYLTDALKAYRSGARQHQTMQANAGLLTDEDIADIAAWLAASGEDYNDETVGEPLQLAATCAGCHGVAGVAPAGQWPTLAGQYKSYIEQSLQAYKSGARQNAIMQGMAAGLSDHDISQLAGYFAKQRGPLRTTPTNN